MLELKERDGLARICELATRHGKVTTPTLLPVVNPNQLTITPREMRDRFKVQMLITNSYIIRSDEVLREKALLEGLHKLLDFDGAIMTDSGTFQSYVYGKVDVDHKEIVEFQRDIGSDVGTILDVFSEPDWTKEKTSAAVEETIRRAKESTQLKGDMSLAGPVQGGVYPDLRESCARRLSEMDFDLHPIGGVVPLLENYRYGDIVEIVLASKKGLDPSRPVHLFGAGHPMIFPLAVLLGCDMFDSASYAKYAREERMMYPTGTKFLNDHRDLACDCPACRDTSVEELKVLPPKERVKAIAEHNLFVSLRELRKVRNAIHEGSIWELVEMRARAHPSLLVALKSLKKHVDYLEKFEPASRSSAFFYCGPESHDRPAVARYRERFFSRYRRPGARALVGFEEGRKPYSRTYAKEISEISSRVDADFLVASFFGPVPIELDELYPIAQSVIPEHLDDEVVGRIRRTMERHAHQHGYSLAVMWEGDQTMRVLEELVPGRSRFDLDLYRVKAVLDLQFGKGAADVLDGRRVEFIKSKNTGKIRNIIIDGTHAFSMRARDGRLTPKIEGAKMLMEKLPGNAMRVVLEDEPAEFAAKGSNVFAKFVVDCDENIRPGDSVLVINTKGELAAVGLALMAREEMLAFKRGIAVRVKEASED
jgi:7-cyano-7-deazaguanine tRNA-ribosyltransferase